MVYSKGYNNISNKIKGDDILKSNEFIEMVTEDIKRCDVFLERGLDVMPLLNELIGKYSKVSQNFPDIEMNAVLFKIRPTVPIEYIRTIQGFLKAYSLNCCEDFRFDDTKNVGINVITNISNENKNDVSVITFAKAKNIVENMSSLKDEEICEINAKIDELEQIVNSTERKTKKWEMAKDIIKWVADKGIDVGLTLLPLILKLGE